MKYWLIVTQHMLCWCQLHKTSTLG